MADQEVKLTPQQLAAVHHMEGSSFVVACPGSGKTRTLIAKLALCLEEVAGTPKRVGCITYTNAAVYEIDARLRALGSNVGDGQCDVSTIHSFCLNNILLNFGWLLPQYPNGFTVLPSDSEKYAEVAGKVIDEFDLDRNVREDIESLWRSPSGAPASIGKLPAKAAVRFWECLENEGLIDFPSMIYYSYKLLSEYPRIGDALSARYAWILVDEFQDTAEIQLALLRIIATKGHTKFFLVGDPHQSIYGFAGVTPSLIANFAKSIDARDDFALTENFRNSGHIISHAESLCPRKPAMTPVGPSTTEPVEPAYFHVHSTAEGLVTHFISKVREMGINFGESAVLAPWWVTLLPIGRKLREEGIPVIGPGARPYKRSHLVARFAEQLCQYVEQPDPNLIPKIERELFFLIAGATGRADFRVYSYEGRLAIYRAIRIAQEARIRTDIGIEWLESSIVQFGTVFVESEFLPNSLCHLLIESVSDIKADMIARRVDVEHLTVADLGMFASSDNSLKLLTMHGAKGHEFDAVAVVDLHDGKVPHYSAGDDEELLAEAKRLLYVSMTRARRLLMLFTSDDDKKRPVSRFLRDAGF